MIYDIDVRKRENILAWICIIILGVALFHGVTATPTGPVITYQANETKNPDSALSLNTSGGSITTVVLNATTQNIRWKAYVGNVSGDLVLQNGNNYSVFEWDLGVIAGEVYATRKAASVDWTNINCSNETHVALEEKALNHTNPNDNISTTFSSKDHEEFLVGTSHFAADQCYSIFTYVNNTRQTEYFQEMLLYDGTNVTNGNVVYATVLEQDKPGFDNATYDFQMILPENGLETWKSSTAYYFYVEIT